MQELFLRGLSIVSPHGTTQMLLTSLPDDGAMLFFSDASRSRLAIGIQSENIVMGMDRKDPGGPAIGIGVNHDECGISVYYRHGPPAFMVSLDQEGKCQITIRDAQCNTLWTTESTDK